MHFWFLATSVSRIQSRHKTTCWQLQVELCSENEKAVLAVVLILCASVEQFQSSLDYSNAPIEEPSFRRSTMTDPAGPNEEQHESRSPLRNYRAKDVF